MGSFLWDFGMTHHTLVHHNVLMTSMQHMSHHCCPHSLYQGFDFLLIEKQTRII